MQWRELGELFHEVHGSVPISLNSNLTLVGPLERLLKGDLIDHIATDVKAPPWELYGLPRNSSDKLWSLFLRGLDLVSEYSVPLELRIPVAKGLEQWPWIEEAVSRITTDFYVVLNPLVGKPLTSPRDEMWCQQHCWPEREVKLLKKRLEFLGLRVYLNQTFEIQAGDTRLRN
ncbi:anaerobic ribonucleoside-triphosphate reductase activating enzyme [Pyrococcus sp. ST04]|nr:anaerobic ribonucleoside-triphosphate reductase activating enzyme [Pyrococcus sp. ST04]